MLRLRWGSGDAPRGRAVPAGEYTLAGYRVVRGEWMISAAAGREKLQLEPGETVALEIEPKVRVKLAPTVARDGARLAMTILGEGKAGLTIYRAGRRIPIEYALEDAAGEVLASGTMRYG